MNGTVKLISILPSFNFLSSFTSFVIVTR
jgi:hypothetical protein